MRYQDINLKNTTANECFYRINEIEADWRNYQDCSIQQWNSGASDLQLKKGAISKIEALTHKLFATGI